LRLASTFLSLGVPPLEWAAFFDEWRLESIRQLSRLSEDEFQKELLNPQFEEVFVGVRDPSQLTLNGLVRAVERDYSVIWGDGSGSPIYDASIGMGRVEKKFPPPPRVKAKPPTTHPATISNVGRPPPTSVWGPDKPKKLTSEERRALLRTAHQNISALDEIGWSDHSESFSQGGGCDENDDFYDCYQELDELQGDDY